MDRIKRVKRKREKEDQQIERSNRVEVIIHSDSQLSCISLAFTTPTMSIFLCSTLICCSIFALLAISRSLWRESLSTYEYFIHRLLIPLAKLDQNFPMHLKGVSFSKKDSIVSSMLNWTPTTHLDLHLEWRRCWDPLLERWLSEMEPLVSECHGCHRLGPCNFDQIRLLDHLDPRHETRHYWEEGQSRDKDPKLELTHCALTMDQKAHGTKEIPSAFDVS